MPADLLGFEGLVEHSNDCVAATDHAVDIVGALINLMIPLSRVANELDIWSSFEFNMVEIADHLANPSSMMPQKKNPAIFEFCRMALGQMLGAYSEIVCGSHAVMYGDVIEMRELTFSIHPKIKEVCKQLKIMGEAVDTMIVKKDIMLKRAAEGFSTVTELAAVLYREAGMPLRMAHGVVAEVVRKMLDMGKFTSDITPEIVDAVAKKVTGNPVGINKELLESALDPVKFVEAHKSCGGVASVEVERMIHNRNEKLEEMEKRHEKRLQRLKDAEKKLNAQVERIIK
jgi:argininosuccinate lyase